LIIRPTREIGYGIFLLTSLEGNSYDFEVDFDNLDKILLSKNPFDKVI